jgi:hypothetical protein
MRAFVSARESLELLPVHDVFWRGVSLLNVGMEEALNGHIDHALDYSSRRARAVRRRTFTACWPQPTGSAKRAPGRANSAAAQYQQVLAEAIGGAEMLDDQAVTSLGLAKIAYEHDDLDVAEQQAARARDLSQQRSNEEEVVHTSLLLARIQQARGQTTQAQDTLRALATRTQRPLLVLEIQCWQARLALMSGDVETARRWATANSQRRDVPHVQHEQTALLLAHVQLLDHKPEAALKVLELMAQRAHHNGRLRSGWKSCVCKRWLMPTKRTQRARTWR